MRRIALGLIAVLSVVLSAVGVAPVARGAQTVTIAAVNNPAMIELQKLSPKFEAANPDIKLNWVVVEENVLRQRITTDISTQSGQFDLVFLGLYETPIFAKRGWLREMKDLPAAYDAEDVFKSLRDGLSLGDPSNGGKLYALPFYGESSMLMYRKDLFEAKGLTMPAKPTWEDVEKFAAALNDSANGVYGIALRGKPGWGENMALVTTLVNAFGGSWFDMNWKPQVDSPAWKKAVSFYVDLMKKYGPPGASSNGFNENLTLFASGKAAMWVDATVAAGTLSDPKESQVVGKVGYADAPIGVTPKGSHWLWSWAFAIPQASKSPEAAQKFAVWATSKDYVDLVAADTGWATVPPGTRKSTYDNPEYQKAAPFAGVLLHAGDG